ncbi:MAG: hypothetical protein AVDCRST_MAG38-155 [uncultured Solirubrobacteraceae bacterium]|uniref:Uncharacterized protein n=1 Tax=uncultured Solirubrobacteraceae bacterium TaxID=1162706 RepID=A0A6J4R539_9ACTN|nr:MAG: hypothetical protein AVDCRST_MAG38-155 [uncultured Solirubrobacteraceae bacterium]
MSVRLLASNGIKLLLLLPILLGAPQTVKAICAAGLLLSLMVDFALYRRDRAAFDDESGDRIEPVPMPPSRPQRDKR